jgi:hypothetical protein
MIFWLQLFLSTIAGPSQWNVTRLVPNRCPNVPKRLGSGKRSGEWFGSTKPLCATPRHPAPLP